MKKIILVFALIVSIAIGASAKDTYSRDVSVLPEAARTALAKNFKSKVNLIKIDKELGRISEYEVILNDGTEITFDSKGNWDNVEVRKSSSVPSAMIPQPIKNYVQTKHKGARIIGIDKERHGYDIELSNGVEIQFDKNGTFLRYDN